MKTTAHSVQLPGVEKLRRLIRDVPDFPKPGILFKDITPLLADAAGLALAVELMAQPFRGEQIDMVVEGPLEKPIGRSREETIESILADYVAKLEIYAGCHPEQFLFPISGRSGQMMIQPLNDDTVT